MSEPTPIVAWVGPMFSSKTERLVDSIDEFDDSKRRLVAMPYREDMKNTIQSRAHGEERKVVGKPLHSLPIRYLDVLHVDELNFFDPKVVNQLSKLAQNGAQVRVAMLDRTFRGEHWPTYTALRELEARSPELITVHECLAWCDVCDVNGQKGVDAQFSVRYVNDEKVFHVVTASPFIDDRSFWIRAHFGCAHVVP